VVERAGVVQIPVYEAKTRIGDVGVFIDRVDAPGVERAGAPDNPIDFVSFLEQQFHQV
jgi:hypothetical protein